MKVKYNNTDFSGFYSSTYLLPLFDFETWRFDWHIVHVITTTV